MKFLWLALLTFVLPLGAEGQELKEPEGMVVLTVAGDIKVANRGAPHFLEDPFLGFHELAFEQAAEFDMSMLNELEQGSLTVKLSKWPEPSVMEGPSLRALLDAVGAAGQVGVTITALDGFRVELSAEAVAAQDWLVAVKRDGQPLGIGAHGPAWILFPPAAADHLATREESANWPWTTFFIEVVAAP